MFIISFRLEKHKWDKNEPDVNMRVGLALSDWRWWTLSNTYQTRFLQKFHVCSLLHFINSLSCCFLNQPSLSISKIYVPFYHFSFTLTLNFIRLCKSIFLWFPFFLSFLHRPKTPVEKALEFFHFDFEFADEPADTSLMQNIIVFEKNKQYPDFFITDSRGFSKVRTCKKQIICSCSVC